MEVDNKTPLINTIKLNKFSIGHKITDKVPTVFKDSTIGDVRALLYNNKHHFNTINYIYVISRHGKLSGVFSIKEVFNQSPETKVEDIMITDVYKVHPHVHEEKVAHYALDMNIKAVPVTDEENNFLGVASNDTLFSILEKETHEDFLRLVGIVGKAHTFKDALNIPVLTSFLRRSPWIVLGLFGGILAAKIVGGFEQILSKNLMLAFFIPHIVYISDAVGTQTQTLFVRDMATIQNLPFKFYAVKQILTSSLIALLCGFVTFCIVGVMWTQFYTGFVIGLSTFLAVGSSSLVALATPYLLFKGKQDPAIGSGPFSTIVQDLLSIIIYFSVASILM